ncbi:MAG: lycopene cyclase family protein, partial [Acidobacteriota bacterium]
MARRALLVAGGGCAGLSLAVHFLEAGIDDRPIVVIEPRRHYASDRTWCSWRFGSHPFEAAVGHQWNRWAVSNGPSRAIAASTRYPYQCIAAGDFYALALDRLRNAPNVDLHLGTRVTGCEQTSHQVRVETDRGHREGAYLFDSRPPKATSGLTQLFHGLFVRTSAPVFDPETVELMDFRLAPTTSSRRPDEICFAYLLPFSTTEALVEATYFVRSPHDRPLDVSSVPESEAKIREYLAAHHGVGPHLEIQGEEVGSIPMTPELAAPQSATARVIDIGIRGGHARASSGYAFGAIQATARRIAQAVRSGRSPAAVTTWRRRARFLDRVFLAFLEREPGLAPLAFESLFRRVPADGLVRFLADRDHL